ncbi:MAG TPA: hypothetical protein VJT72_16740 [Pseudonocardiaceae bacterium]|nr:hypothetical protein [Pseudonocardiaceae bacterium]
MSDEGRAASPASGERAVVLEDREGETELVAVERALRSTDDDAFESAPGFFNATSSSLAQGRRFHGSERDVPISKKSAAIVSLAGSMSPRARVNCQL